jgi:hypothetical protein
MPFQGKVGCGGDRAQRFGRQAHLDLDDPAALYAGEVVMVMRATATDTVPMDAIDEFHAIQYATLDERVDGAEHGGAPEPWVGALQVAPEIIGREIGAPGGDLCQTLSDQTPGTRIAQAKLVEGGDNRSRCRHGARRPFVA